jgi:hypothetical protein
MQFGFKRTGRKYICAVHHSDTVYDGRMVNGFIVQKNKAKINRKFKAGMLQSISLERAAHDPEENA